MVMGCRMTITREGEHADNHTIDAKGGIARRFDFQYILSNNKARYAIAGYFALGTQNIAINITTQGKTIKVESNNPGIGRPDVTFDGNNKSFSEGDEYTWESDLFKFWVKRETDGADFKEFTAKILPR